MANGGVCQFALTCARTKRAVLLHSGCRLGNLDDGVHRPTKDGAGGPDQAEKEEVVDDRKDESRDVAAFRVLYLLHYLVSPPAQRIEVQHG